MSTNDAWKVYAVVGSTFLVLGLKVVPECQVIGFRYWLCMPVVTLPNQLTDFFVLPYKEVHKCHVSKQGCSLLCHNI